ncbi:MAG: S9 family peptidase [Bacteroidetes bacterium]|nr:MAG: S9 family peptidase [Bacteroidota bacterium]
MKIALLSIFYLSALCSFAQQLILPVQDLDPKNFEHVKSKNVQEDIEYHFLDSLLFQRIRYQSDGQEVEAYIVRPKTDQILPIVLFNRGGNRHYFEIGERTLTDWIAPIARQGFAIFATQYREQDEFGGKDLQDVFHLLDLAKQQNYVDSNKIGMVGWSRGGMMTYLSLKMRTDIDCAVIGGAPSDLLKLIEERPKMDLLFEKLIPNYREHQQVELQKRSPIYWAEQLHPCQLLLMHGDQDQRVSVQHTHRLSDKLKSLGYPHKTLIFEGDDHILRNHHQEKDRMIGQWLRQHLY